MPRIKPNKFDKYLVFRETFDSIKSVSDNGGVFSKAYAVNKSINFAADGYISYANISSRIESAMANGRKLTITALIDTTNASESLVAFGNGSTYGFEFGISGTKLYSLTPGNTPGTADVVNTGIRRITWVQGVGFYIDGISDKAFATVSTGGAGGTFYLGGLGTTREYTGKVKEVSVYETQLTAEEVKDLYEQDTYSEIERPIINLPLRSWYYKANGVELVMDGDMEAAGTTSWPNSFHVVVSKDTVSPLRGTQSLRLTYTDYAISYTRQTILTSGKRYKVSGIAQSDGVGVPRLTDSTNIIWNGTNSTSEQPFNFEFIAAGTGFTLYADTLGAGNYVRFDDVTVQLMEARADNKGTLGGYALRGDGSTTTTFPTQLSPHGMSFDGGDWLELLNTEALFNWTDSFTWGCLIKTAASAFQSNVFSNLDASQGYKGSEVYISAAVSTVNFQMIGTGQLSVNAPLAASASKIFTGTIFVTHDGTHVPSGVKIYVNGESQTVTEAANTLTGTTSNGRTTLIGARHANSTSKQEMVPSGTQIRSPYMKRAVLTPMQIRKIHNRMMASLNI